MFLREVASPGHENVKNKYYRMKNEKYNAIPL
jgi:hypothetical protein